MTTSTIIQELERLPIQERLFVIKRALRSIRAEKEKSLKEAVESMYDDYKSDGELTAFTAIDNEPF